MTDCNGVSKGPFSHSLLFFILLIVVFSLVMLGSLLIHESQFMVGIGSMGKVGGWHKCTLPKCSIVCFLHWFLEIHCLLSMSINYEQERYIFIYSLSSQVLELGEAHVYEKKFF